jgi:hypothetical protein
MKLSKLEYLAWSILMTTEVTLQEAEKEEIEPFLKGYRAAQKHTAENIIKYAKQFDEHVKELKENKYKGYLTEDVDLSGNLGQEVDEYA